MITAGESRVVKMIAIGSEGEILPPCGRCREFLGRLHDDNREAEVMVGAGTVVRLKDLLPYDWREAAGDHAGRRPRTTPWSCTPIPTTRPPCRRISRP